MNKYKKMLERITGVLSGLPITEYPCQYYGTKNEDECIYCLNERAKQLLDEPELKIKIHCKCCHVSFETFETGDIYCSLCDSEYGCFHP